MRLLVIGRSGQVALSLAERATLHSSRPDVTCASRPDADLSVPATLDPLVDPERFDAVINAGAYTAVDVAETDHAAAHALNASGPGALAALCAQRALPFIHISTDYVFDGTGDRPHREDDPLNPQSVYGRTKAEGEAAVREAGGRALIVRTAWVYSPFGKNFVKTMLRLGATRPELKVVADQHGNPTNALDLADALLSLAASASEWPAEPDVVHAVGEGATTWHAFACAAFDAARLTPTVHAITTAEFPTPARRPANSRLDTAKLKARYGLALPHWQESLPPVVARILADAP